MSATKLPAELVAGTAELPWAEVKGMRIVVDHAYHSIDYERVWRTLRDDVPGLGRVVGRWAQREFGRDFGMSTEARVERERAQVRDTGARPLAKTIRVANVPPGSSRGY